MATLINDEDIVVVDPQLNDYVAGKIYVITYNDETYIKQVQCPKKNIIVLKSLNSNYEDKYIIDEEIKQVKIEGRVVKELAKILKHNQVEFFKVLTPLTFKVIKQNLH